MHLHYLLVVVFLSLVAVEAFPRVRRAQRTTPAIIEDDDSQEVGVHRAAARSRRYRSAVHP